ncbi:MAG: hypothetical protein V3U76_04090 [Granulosicoccus sp.]
MSYDPHEENIVTTRGTLLFTYIEKNDHVFIPVDHTKGCPRTPAIGEMCYITGPDENGEKTTVHGRVNYINNTFRFNRESGSFTFYITIVLDENDTKGSKTFWDR